ncbi:MAG: helix-turn-helix domain-containing protein [Casimicrobiaceae bacterium]|nr:helix-turn-helix domain-containing protein [Casimicrobiaceae bacterium]MCX8099574.1 helix-turn-helix domain-containing protein [Casimicrobiaceae bacterium]MDW8312694.1 IclR family transcriptional regulator C-terminal domain-containing protein [Burkholderiales bacterium]
MSAHENAAGNEAPVQEGGQREAAAVSIAQGDLVAGLARGLAVIESFDDEHPRQSIAEVARRASLSRSAARRHLLSLVHFGYADTDGRRFWLLPRVLRLGQSYLSSARLPRLVQPFAQRVSQATGETVNVSVLDGHEVVYIARSNPPRHLAVGYAVGARVPAHVVTPGPVILSTWSEAALVRWIAEHPFTKFTAKTVIERDVFLDEVRQAREQGFWVTVGQYDASFAGIAVALVDRRGHCHGAMSTTVLASLYTPERMVRELLPHLREAAQTLRSIL